MTKFDYGWCDYAWPYGKYRLKAIYFVSYGFSANTIQKNKRYPLRMIKTIRKQLLTEPYIADVYYKQLLSLKELNK